ncbi:50S ribosomal protein L9 [Hydrogenobacter hydrogenophilus]|uniref:Large ribosomal subunit protein bL9 n=1 Tax=Hydrogenobacter hydrogenophilus TaxID=35835 RepID=A0A285P6P0_9AQUI|nr:50S ribosomal protein L9 [Hydrogenobacter hydrogenophilus]SNZ16927.1 LSU ribosomal protein L9P [Hydrogenobacter hydrogenophilus]
MKVILVQDLEGYGVFGDVIEVKDGFANNYLIPRGIAMPATEGNLRHIQSILQQKMRKLEREKEKALNLAQALKGMILEISKPIGEKGKLFGSVTAGDIANALKERGFDIDRKRIIIKTPIKDVGIYTVQVRLHPQVSVDIKVEVKPA